MKKEKVVGALGSVSGAASILGSWQVCHNVCLGIIALLSVVGITITGMPLLFFTKVAVPFWIAAFVLLLITLIIYAKKGCISKHLIIFNSGLIIAGIPFQSLRKFSVLFWIVGGVIAASGLFLFVKSRVKRARKAKFADYAPYLLLILVFGLLIYTVVGFIGIPVSEKSIAKQAVPAFNSISSGDTQPGSVSIELTPLGVKDGKFQVRIAASTHSVELSQFDLKEITVLEYDGKVVKPISAPGFAGHHSSGVIEFDVGSISKFTIKIKGIPNVEERVFSWE